MKNNEEFRACVYARAEREKERIAARRLMARNACLSVAMVLLVAALTVPLARSPQPGADPRTDPALEKTQDVSRSANLAGAPIAPRMVLLVSSSGKTQAVVLENQDQQKDFVSKYAAAMHMGDDEGLALPASDVKTIHSTDELTQFLAELPEAAVAVTPDYDEAFFRDNDLRVMPMELSAQDSARDMSTTEVKAAASTEPLATIPDATSAESAALPDGDDPTQATEAAETTAEQTTAVPSPPQAGNGLQLQAGMKVLILVPVNKG